MEEKVCYLMRHGESEANAHGHGYTAVDPPLTIRGTEQARAWAVSGELSGLGIEAVFVSPLCRTLQTASLAFRGSPAPMFVTPSAREHCWWEAQNRGSALAELSAKLER